MPWDCASCNETVEKDTVIKCPSCGTDKASWTMVADTTRTFSVTRSKKAEYLKGEGSDPCPQAEPPYPEVTCVDTEEAVAVPKSVARSLAKKDQLPAPEQILFLRLKPKAGADVTVTLTPEYETKEIAELEFPEDAEPGEDGTLDVRFLFVHGGGEDVTIPGVHVVDISEATDRGFAPQVGVKALVRKRKVLPISGEYREFEFSV
jgi:hypothetical protein